MYFSWILFQIRIGHVAKLSEAVRGRREHGAEEALCQPVHGDLGELRQRRYQYIGKIPKNPSPLSLNKVMCTRYVVGLDALRHCTQRLSHCMVLKNKPGHGNQLRCQLYFIYNI
jgi:hypothetical protein